MKHKFLLMFVAACLAVAFVCGCSANKVAAKVGDRTVTLKDVENAYLNYINQYGAYLSADDDAARKTVVDSAVDMVIESEMGLYQAELAGITLTDEEVAQAKADAESDYEETFNTYLEYAESSGGSDVRATANKYFTSMLTENGFTISTYKDKLFESEKSSRISEKFQNQIFSEADVSEEALRTAYDSEMENEKVAFDAANSDFFTYLNYNVYGYTCHPVYIPAGMVRAKVIIVSDASMADNIMSQLNEGADFDELYALYNEEVLFDDPMFEDGYLFCEGCSFDQQLTDSILALQDGEFTQVSMADGCCAVAQRIRTEDAFAYEYEDMIDTVRSYLISYIQSTYYSEKMSAWCSDDSLVTKYESVYANVGK